MQEYSIAYKNFIEKKGMVYEKKSRNSKNKTSRES